MAVSLTSLSQLLRRALPKKTGATEAALNDKAAFRKKYGIAPKGTPPKGGWPASAYGFPLPPADHPQALRYAHAVLSRAHTSKKYPAAVLARQIRKAQAIVKKHNKGYRPSKSASAMARKESHARRGALLEYIPSRPPGSWERISGLIQKAAQASELFGGPADDDPKLNSEETVRSWDIYIYASYPSKNTVVIGNDKLGKLWIASYEVDDDGDVSFSDVKPTDLAFQTEARRKVQRTIAKRVLAKGVKREALAIVGNVLIVGAGKLREAIALSGSAEDQANRTHAQAKALRRHVRALGKAVAASPCPCGKRGHKPSLMATFPDSKTVVTSCQNGLHSAKYDVKGGKLALGAGTPVEATVKKARSREAVRPLRESAGSGAEASLHFVARIREAKIDKDGAQAICVMLEEGPGNPSDRHYYPGETLKEAVDAGVFEGAQTFADHPTAIEDRVRPERSVRDLIGWWSNVHIEEGEGRSQMVGTFNLETGNDFALNKMREAKRYAESNPEKPGYVGFSIAAAGVSHPQEIDGKTYNVVDRITEAVSTDMVTRAGAGGKLLTLKEAMHMKETIALDEARKIAESAASAVVKKLKETDKKRIKDALEAVGVELTPEQDEALDKELGVVDGGAIDKAIDQATGNEDEADDEESDTMEDILGDDDGDGDGENGDADEDDGEDNDDEDEPVEARRKESTKLQALMRENARLKEQNHKLAARESLRTAKSKAAKICESLKVPARARAYVMAELLECKDEKAMSERAKALLEGIIRPVWGEGIEGAPARATESTSLITL
ncbi:hypothetical protein EPN42_05645 [bacterium]|nr:MAG: hypothetical protein EPN42_05645 [bacterium]